MVLVCLDFVSMNCCAYDFCNYELLSVRIFVSMSKRNKNMKICIQFLFLNHGKNFSIL